MSAHPLPELIDSHCHLHYDYAPKSSADLVAEAATHGVRTLVTVGVDLATMDAVRAVSEAHERVFHTVGVHPHDVKDLAPGDLARLEAAARHPKCVAIGEIGLDYHYDHSPRETQRGQLRAQLDLALKVALPVVIHARDAEEDLLPELQAYARQVPAGRPVGVIHCFTGTRVFGEACIAAGFYISFSGILTFKNADALRACAEAFPLDRLLVETDSPFLAPLPFRGKKCEPWMVTKTAEKLAELKRVDFCAVAAATTANARAVFGLS